MPRYRKYRGKNNYRRKGYRKTKKINIRKEIEKYLAAKTEIKTFDVEAAGTISNANLSITQPLPVKGTNSYNRIGDVINIVSHYFQFDFALPLVSPDTYNTIRFIFVYDRLCRGTAFDPDLLLQNKTTYPFVTPLNKTYAGRFKVLIDKTYTINDSGNQRLVKKFYINFKKGKRQEYSNNLGTLADIREGAYFAYIIGDSSAASHPIFNYYWRMNYTDC